MPVGAGTDGTAAGGTRQDDDGRAIGSEAPRRALELSPATVITWAVRSLYLDQALPRGPMVQWLLQALTGVKLTHLQFRTFFQGCPGLRPEPMAFKKFNFSVVLEAPPEGFEGFVSEEDVSNQLDAELWEEVARCLAFGGWPKVDDPSHRHYVVASWLQDVSEFLGKLPFGRLVSIVRSSAQGLGLLGHRNGLLVPYAQSEECERRVNACTGKPTSVAPDEQYVKTWDELRKCLRSLLSMQAPCAELEVSKLKASFRVCFRRELSETVFGHRCLSKLLGDPQLGDEFKLETVQGSRYMLRFVDSNSGGPEPLALTVLLQ